MRKIFSEYGCTEILHVQYMSILIASLYNVVPHCKDWSIFLFDVADDLVPCKTITALM